MTPEEWLENAENHGDAEHEAARNALREVLFLHYPQAVTRDGGKTVFNQCRECRTRWFRDGCLTYQNIAYALGLLNTEEDPPAQWSNPSHLKSGPRACRVWSATWTSANEKENTMTITVYTKTHCQQCLMTKRWLDKRGHTYQTINLEESPDDLAAIQKLGYAQAPVVVVSQRGGPDVHWSGFDPIELSEYIGEVAA